MPGANINKETEVAAQDDAPHVVAYRVGRLEDRFDKFEDKLDLLANQFATIAYVDRAVGQAQEDCTKAAAVNGAAVARVSTDIENLQKATSDIDLIRRLVYGAVGIILLAVISGLVGLVVITN